MDWKDSENEYLIKKTLLSLYIEFTDDSLPNYLLTTTNSPKEVVTNFSNQLNNFIFLLNTG